MSDYKVDVIVRNKRNRDVVDKLIDASPEEASFILYDKYCSSVDCRKAFNKVLSNNVAVNVKEFLRIFGVKKK